MIQKNQEDKTKFLLNVKFVTEFKNNNGLRCHFNGAHKMVRELKCNICQSVFNLQSKLTSHVKNAHGNQMKCHKCDSCGNHET